MKKNKIEPVLLRFALVAVGLISIVGVYLSIPQQISIASVDTKNEACLALNSAANANMDCTNTDTAEAAASTEAEKGLSELIKTGVSIVSLLVGAVSVIMIIVGGFKYVTSNGDANQTKSAKDTVMYALIGLLLVGFAQTLVRFVWSKT
jgi:hypothetical protein